LWEEHDLSDFNDANELDELLRFLSDKGLVEDWTQDLLYLSKLGVEEVEQALSNTETPTKHFPALRELALTHLRQR
jgi:hypothetical protein